MVSINESRNVDASQDRAWEVLSDVDRDLEYWTGLASIRNIRREGNLIEREVVIRFMGNKGTQKITLNPKVSIHLAMIDGPLTGSREIELVQLDAKKTRIDVSWDIQFATIPAFAQGFVRARLEEGTREALAKIATAAESGRRQPLHQSRT